MPSMSQQVAPAPASATELAQDPTTARLEQIDRLQQRTMQLELRAADLSSKSSQLREQRDAASKADRPRLDKQLADVQHDFMAAGIEASATRERIAQLQSTLRPQAPVPITIQPPQDPFLGREQIMQVLGGSALLMAPLVLALARRLWVRGARAPAAVDLESSPRLQRMEQAIESIAVEVERIGEAQRFTTKLLTERPLAAEVNRIAAPVVAPVRREPGTITPH
jgi:hypothetical protein